MQFDAALNIVLVEDDESQANYIASLLSKEIYKVKIISDGLEAYHYILNHPEIDIVLLDNTLPTISGIDIIQNLRAKNNYTPIVFVTANEDIQLVIKAMRNGALDFILKSSPDFHNELIQIIRKVTQLIYTQHQKRLLEKRVLENEEKYQKAFGLNASIMAISTLKEGRYLEVNESFCKTTGYKREEIIGKTVKELQLYDDFDNRKFIEEEILKTGKIRNQELTFVNRYGERLNAIASMDLISLNNEQCIVSVITDITQRKKAEEKLNETQIRFRALLDNLPFMAWLKNSKGQYLAINEVFRSNLGLEYNHIIGKSPWDLFPTNHADQLFEDDQNVLSSGNKFTKQIKEEIGGRPMVFEQTIMPVFDKSKLIIGTVGFLIDITEKTNWQQQLAESEKKYRQLVENANEIIFKTDFGGVFTYVNPTAIRLIEYSESELIGRRYLDLIAPDFQEWVMSFYKNQLSNLTPTTYLEFPIITKSGKEMWVGQNLQLNIQNGIIIEITATTRDITDLIKAKKELEFTSARLKTIITNIQSGVLVEDSERKIVIINQLFCQMFQIPGSPEVFIGLDSNMFFESLSFRSKTNSSFIERINFIIQNKQIVTRELIELENGRIFERDYVSLILHGNNIGHFWQYRDITEQKKAAEQIQQSEARLQIAIKGGKNGLWEWDYTNKRVLFTESTFEMLGYPPEYKTIINKWQNLRHPDDNATSERMLMNHIYGETEYYEVEERLRKFDGEYKWVLTRGKVMDWSPDGIPCHIFGVSTDVDILKAMELELKFAKAEADKANDAKGRFLANMSHEIRTPMNGIIGLSKLLNKTELNHRQTEYLNSIVSSSENMMVIINDILDFSKITEGKLSLEKIDFNLFELINKAIIAFKYAAQSKNIELLLSFDNQINPIVKSDPVRINQIIINLLNNAIKFTSKGKVTVNIVLEKKEPHLSIITFSVEDTGIGISKDNQQLIFESFSQEDSSISRKFGGTGLGLAISKELIEMLGGTIQLDSEKNKGSRFYFSLPLDNGNAENIKTVDLDEDKKLDLFNIKILVAEDHKINQFYIKSVLANWNNIPDIAENGLEAIEMVKIKAYDIVFMDKEMPEMSGIEATRIIRTQLKIKIPIIALTAATLPETLEELRQSGITDIVIKPFQPNDLLATILKHTDIKLSDENSNSTSSTSKKFDPKLYNLGNLQKTFKNQRTIHEMVNLFIAKTPQLWNELLAEFKADNFNNALKLIDKIKPSVEFLGITQLQKIITQMEQECKTLNKDQKIELLCNNFDKIIQIVFIQLKEDKSLQG